jgi:hypothetical protein
MTLVSDKKVLLSPSESEEAARIQALVNRVSDRILDASGLKHQYNWQVVVVKAKEVNAFVMPNGKIVVFTGLLPIAKNEAGLATIISHEIAHVIAQHGAEKVSQALVAEVALQAVNVGLTRMQSRHRSVVSAAIGLGAQYGILLPFSREHELEADRIGLLIMAKAGYDPSEAAGFWERMDAMASSGPWEFLSTHPSPETRRSQLVSWLPEAKIVYANQNLPLSYKLSEVERVRLELAKQEAIAPIAPRPSFLPGYWWRVQASNQPKPITNKYVRKTTCSVGDCYIVEWESGATLLNEDYAVVEIRLEKGEYVRMSPPMKLIEWPLRLGKEWSQELTIENHKGQKSTVSLKVEVVAYEPVTVQSGSFMAFKLIFSLGGTKIQEYWYAPEVRNLVRLITHTGLFQTVSSEMIEYQKTDEPVVKAGWAE